MTLELITGPASEPVTLAEAKLQRRVEHALDDAWFSMAIEAARRIAEHKTGRVLIAQTWELVADGFPTGWLALGKAPLASITSIEYFDGDGTTQTLDPGLYVIADAAAGQIRPIEGESWPTTYSRDDAVTIRFVAGYADAAAVPANVREWILVHIATAHKHREAFASGVSISDLPNRFVDGLLDAEKDYS